MNYWKPVRTPEMACILGYLEQRSGFTGWTSITMRLNVFYSRPLKCLFASSATLKHKNAWQNQIGKCSRPMKLRIRSFNYSDSTVRDLLTTDVAFSIADRSLLTHFTSFFLVSSCCQILSTRQPLPRRVRATNWSRATLRAILRDQKARLFCGYVPWCGHACQKQPSTKTASRCLGNTKSG